MPYTYTMVPFTLEEIRESAVRIVIRLALGDYVLRGPRDNILELESRVAWATVASELHSEGYGMVSPEAYATTCGEPPASVTKMIEPDGSLFALVYRVDALVPLPEREERDHLGPLPA
jgi:hypothetical protein